MTVNTLTPEPDSQVVDQHRQYWRPTKTRLVLLAESHVYTAPEELKRSVKSHSLLPESLPHGFVRFVYCLGYGENDLLDSPVRSNPGTWQFWKIFYSCIHGTEPPNNFGLLLKRGTQIDQRIHKKIELLKDLKADGIWLVDASVIALYKPGKPRPKVDYPRVLRASWREQVRDVIEQTRPEGLLCIGKSVAGALKTELDNLQSEWGIKWGVVPQPNARLSRDEHRCILETCHQVSREPGKISQLCTNWSRDDRCPSEVT